MTESPPARTASAFGRPDDSAPWTFQDLQNLPEGYRYEILDGSLLVSPPPHFDHCDATDDLADLLKRHAPAHLRVSGVGFGLGIRGGETYLVPDIVVFRRSAAGSRRDMLLPPDVLLVVEVLSPSNRDNDLVLKRHKYAAAGIPHYWLVDQAARSMTVLRLEKDKYAEAAVVRAGEVWKTDDPYPLALDPADFV